MRQVIPAIFLLLASLNCLAQKNEIGMHLLSYSVFTFSDKYGRTGIASDGKKQFILLNGITYKRHLNKYILRSSFTYRNLTSKTGTKYRYIQSEGTYDESILKLGCQKDLNNRRLTPYFAADLGLLYTGFEGYFKGDAPGYSAYELSGFGFAVSPAFGLKFKLTESLSLNAESCLDLAYMRYNHKENLPQHGEVKFITYNFQTTFNPLQKLSLNVKF